MASTYFNLREANGLIPWLEETFRDLDPIRREAGELTEKVVNAEARVRVNGNSAQDYTADRSRLSELVGLISKRIEEVRGRGIIVRDLKTGLVDFPTLEEGREIYLCWHRGEPEVAYWHETNIGFAGRQPIEPQRYDEEG